MMEIKCAYDQLVATGTLKAHPRNPNKHSADQIERLSKILQYQGIRRPIRVSKLSGYITAGHGLLSACLQLRENKVPVNFQDYENEDQEIQDLISDNSIAQWSELNFGEINVLLQDFDPSFDIELLGLKDFMLDPSEKPQKAPFKCPECGWVKSG